jgi:hypothetical protein
MLVAVYSANLDSDRIGLKKKTCNKKFCYDCLQKNFPIFWENRGNKKWKCPCCLSECNCPQCKKLMKKNSIKETHGAIASEVSESNSPDKLTNVNNIVINKSDILSPSIRRNTYIDKTPHLIQRPKV